MPVTRLRRLRLGNVPGPVCGDLQRLYLRLVPDHHNHPETVNGRPTNGMRVQFETCVDDYGEIWIDGECNRDRGTVQGFNVAQRVQVSSDATPGAQHTIAILAANGPLAAPFGTVFVRFANLGFEWTGS